MKLDRSKLPKGVSFDRKEGLYAELGPEGQVVHLGVYENGQRKPGSYSLDVAPDGSWARVEGPKESRAPQGTAAPASGDPGLMEMWVEVWSMWISQGPKAPSPSKEAKDSSQSAPRCSFCEKRQDEVAQLVAGPKVYICNECIGLCNDMISFEHERPE